MTQVNILLRPLRGGEAKGIGKVLFLLGVGLLSFSGTCLLGFKEFCAQHASMILSFLVASFALILAGESMITLSDHLDPGALRGRLFLRWMAEPLVRPKKNEGLTCFFCGMNFSPLRPARRGSRSPEEFGERIISYVCLGCGKIVCPRCASFQRLESKTGSFSCPGCGSLVL